jgi:hypothetical protein
MSSGPLLPAGLNSSVSIASEFDWSSIEKLLGGSIKGAFRLKPGPSGPGAVTSILITCLFNKYPDWNKKDTGSRSIGKTHENTSSIKEQNGKRMHRRPDSAQIVTNVCKNRNLRGSAFCDLEYFRNDINLLNNGTVIAISAVAFKGREPFVGR